MIKFVSAAAVAAFGVAAAQAGPVTPFIDNVSQGLSCEYDTVSGLPDNCGTVAAARSDIDAINAGAPGFFSLGIDGSITFDVAPLIFGDSVFAVEITNGAPNPSFPEAARFEFSGPDGVEFVEIATFGDSIRASSAGIGATAMMNGGSGVTFEFDLNGGSFNSLTVSDATFSYFAETYDNRSSDGFDIGTLDFNTAAAAVPAPGALGLLGLGLISLAAGRRRR
ncbi:MAG: PEP-CTERM sorting domain-containing protein [Pacificimonas sp.]